MTQHSPGDSQPEGDAWSGSPNPFSREASAPSDGLDADPPAGGATPAVTPVPDPATTPMPQIWPSYPSGPAQPPVPPPYGADQPPLVYGYSPAPDYPSVPPAPTVPPAYGTPDGYPQMPAYGVPPAEVSPYQVNPYGSGYGSSSAYPVVTQTHPQAVVSMILGILGLSFCPVVGFVGLIFGSRARKEIDAEPYRYSGRGMATAGYVLGIISIPVAVAWIAFFVAGFSGAFD